MSLLAVSGVSFAYSGGLPIFQGASFSIKPSDRIAIVGPNGAGKSTLLHVLAGELQPSLGEIIRRDSLIVAVSAQALTIQPATTLFDFVFEAVGPAAQLRKSLQQLEPQLSHPHCAMEYASRINDYGEHGGY